MRAAVPGGDRSSGRRLLARRRDAHQAFFSDPDGNTLILHHRYAPKDAVPPSGSAS